MSTYEESGVSISEGDKASRIAYEAAKATFASRAGMIGEPVTQDGGFAGCLDMGDFYLVQNDDGVGTKEMIGDAIGKHDTIGYDLLAMVIDDAACVGAEVITCSNTMDVKKVDSEKVAQLMEGFKSACIEHKVVIPGGEIAELNTMVNHSVWNATSVGIVDKHKLITGEKVKSGDVIVGFKSAGFRSNGFSLVRHILTNRHGENAYSEPYPGNDYSGRSWGEAVLTPSRIYASLIMDLHGRYGKESKVDLHGVVHITGGGIPGNVVRVLKGCGANGGNLGAHFDNLFAPHEMMTLLKDMGGVSDEEAYHVWNMGLGMCVMATEAEAEVIISLAKDHNIEAQVVGAVNDSGVISLVSAAGETLTF